MTPEKLVEEMAKADCSRIGLSASGVVYAGNIEVARCMLRIVLSAIQRGEVVQATRDMEFGVPYAELKPEFQKFMEGA